MELRSLSSLALLTGSLACGNLTSVTQDQFTIRTTGREVVLTNTAAQATFYLVVEREAAARINFAFCVGLPQCRSVAPDSSVRIPYDEITGYHAGSHEAVVYWWRAVQGSTGLRADSVRSTVSEL
ncbi:MAG TPA: hypothetical protein VMY76_17585 [Gemmatimonadales bacterium]|nr:hypothetical protein [Gemmatimonadales bacterium]